MNNKVGAKLLSDVVIISILSSEGPKDFHDKTLDFHEILHVLKNQKHFYRKNILKYFVIFLEKKILPC